MATVWTNPQELDAGQIELSNYLGEIFKAKGDAWAVLQVTVDVKTDMNSSFRHKI